MANQNMGLTLNQEIFIGITFIVIIIIMILVKDKIMAILIVGLVANFLAISSQLILINERHLKNQSSKNGFENPDLKPNFALQPSDPSKLIPHDPFIIEQFKSGYDLYREPCDMIHNKNIKPYISTNSSVHDSYEGKIDNISVKPNKLSKILDKNDIGYDSDAEFIRDRVVRNDKVNTLKNDRKIILKYVIPEVIKEENKPWWG